MVTILGIRKKKAKHSEEQNNTSEKLNVPANIHECEKLVKKMFGGSSDIIVRPFNTYREKAMVVYVDGMADQNLIDRDIVSPLKLHAFKGDLAVALETPFSVTDDMNIFAERVLTGETGLFYGSIKKAFLIEFKSWQNRPIEEPAAEAVVRGPKEGFVEDIRTNTSMIRRKIKTTDLRFESMKLGRQTKTMVSIAYIEGIVNQEILGEFRGRLKEIDTDMILETGQIEQLIDKNTFSPFSGIGLTQKPDVLAQRLLEGRVGLLVDGTPHALTVPEMFMDNFRTAEDFYNNTLYVNFVRIFRGIALFVTAVLPGLAIAIFTYSQEMIPSVFLSNLISSSMKTPMPFSFEILLMTVMFELIKEAGIRMPKTVGSALTIVGSLIIGDAAINVGLVSAPSVIVVAVAALASFVLPSLTAFMLVYRTLFWLLGSIMGVIGIGAGMVIMIVHISSTESFGRPILSSFSKQEMKDSLFHFPLKNLIYRPTSIARENVKKQR